MKSRCNKISQVCRRRSTLSIPCSSLSGKSSCVTLVFFSLGGGRRLTLCRYLIDSLLSLSLLQKLAKYLGQFSPPPSRKQPLPHCDEYRAKKPCLLHTLFFLCPAPDRPRPCALCTIQQRRGRGRHGESSSISARCRSFVRCHFSAAREGESSSYAQTCTVTAVAKDQNSPTLITSRTNLFCIP